MPLQIIRQDITKMRVDAIVNTTNEKMVAGSGVKPANVREQLTIADGCIVGSSFKKDGVLTNPIDYALARELIEAKG